MITSGKLKKGSSDARNYNERLKNTRRHLESLLSKRTRIDAEIKELRRVLKKRSAQYESTLRADLSLEPDEFLESLVESGQIDKLEFAREITYFQEFDEELVSVQTLLEYLDENQ